VPGLPDVFVKKSQKAQSINCKNYCLTFTVENTQIISATSVFLQKLPIVDN
jgi:hypothetical protein